MSTIIAGRFQEQSQIDDIVEELLRSGFARERISYFYLNPPGQHDTYSIGGDANISGGAKESDKGVAMGAAAGAAVGVAATPFLGPVGTVTGGLLGAHIGGLVGSLSEMKDKGETGEHGEDRENATVPRHAGMMLAIAVGDQEYEDRAVSLLRSFGAADIERAEGTIENGDWSDFNPMSSPTLLHSSSEQHLPNGPAQRA